MKAKNLLLMVVMAGLSLTSVHAKTIYYVKINGTGDLANLTVSTGTFSPTTYIYQLGATVQRSKV